MNIRKEKVLVLAPHTDDGEFGCGGTISKLLRQECEVFYVAFSSAEKSIPDGFDSNILIKEVKEATLSLGINPSNVIILNYEVREFPKFRQSILEEMVRLNKEIQPALVLLPSSADTHQDHKTILEEGFRAFKKATMLGYEIPWNNLIFQTSCFVYLEDEDLEKKIRALKCYRSQAQRSYANENFVRSLAITRGVQIGAQYAETFEVIRWIIR